MSQTQVEPINEDYEYYQYNSQMRIIHSIHDDMFQAQSIIVACKSPKQINHWLENQSTKELLQAFESEKSSVGIPADQKIIENRVNLPNELKGTYIHRLLVNHVAIWASPIYSIYIVKLLDNVFERERNKQQLIIDDLTSRAVPNNHKNDYRYLIYKEAIDRPGFIKLHLIRRHKSTWKKVSEHYDNEAERFFFKDDLPISMTPNLNIKNIIKASFGTDDYTITHAGNAVEIKIEHLPKLHALIEEYFNKNMGTAWLAE